MTVEVERLSTTLSDRREAIKRNEEADDGRWEIPHGDLSSYEDTFGSLLNKRTFSTIIEERKKEGKKSLVIDLMSFGEALRGIDCDSGLAVALSNQRPIWDNNKSTLITGDVLSLKTWKEINGWLDRQDVPDKKANLILCRPIVGIWNLTDNINLHFILLKQAWNLLSRDSGLFITQLPFISADSRSKILEWRSKLAIRYPSLHCEIVPFPSGYDFLGGIASFVKTADSPMHLPTLQELQNVA